MVARLPAGVEGVRLGRRHAQAEQLVRELAAADGSQPVAFVVAEHRDGEWLLGDGWASRFDSRDDAKAYAATVPSPYQVAVFAVVAVDDGRLHPRIGDSC